MIWLIKIAVDLLGSLLAVLLAPLASFLADKYTGRLPRLLRWMETPDVLLPGDMSEPMVASCYARFGWRVTAAYWLTRNKAYRLSSWLSFRPTRDMPMKVCGNPLVSDDTKERGWALFFIGNAWEFYAVYGRSFGIRIRLGYKLQPFFQNDDWSNPLWGMPVLHVSLRGLNG